MVVEIKVLQLSKQFKFPGDLATTHLLSYRYKKVNLKTILDKVTHRMSHSLPLIDSQSIYYSWLICFHILYAFSDVIILFIFKV